MTIDSATVGAGGTVTAVGSTPATTISQRAVFVQAHPSGQVSAVSLANIPHGLIPAIAVNGTAVSDGVQIAVGSANGYPAVWRKTSTGTWSLVSKLSLGIPLLRPDRVVQRDARISGVDYRGSTGPGHLHLG